MALARQVHCGPSCAAVEAHLVPALVEMNGPAAVDKYFRPRPSGEGGANFEFAGAVATCALA